MSNPQLTADVIFVRAETRERLLDALAFAVDYIAPKEPIASDPSVPAELSRLRACLLFGPSQGWVAVYLAPLLREDDIVEKIARLLSVRVGGSLQLALSDGTLSYELYQGGDLVHSYCSNDALPEFRFNPPAKEQGEELVAVFGLSDPGGALSGRLSKLLEGSTEGWGEELYRQLSELFRLPPKLPLSFESVWEEGLLDALVGAGKRAVTVWHEEPLIYLEADPLFESDTTAKRWVH